MVTEKCLVDVCKRPHAASLGRGLCMICYNRAKAMVEQGRTTWEKLVSMGLATQVDRGGDLFTAAFDEKTRSKDAATVGRDHQQDMEDR